MVFGLPGFFQIAFASVLKRLFGSLFKKKLQLKMQWRTPSQAMLCIVMVSVEQITLCWHLLA